MPELRLQHTSLQYSDTPRQQAFDAEKIFRTGYEILTGTEAGPSNMNFEIVHDMAVKYGYRLINKQSNWIAISREIITPKSYRSGQEFVADNSETVGHGYDSVFPWVTFDHTDAEIGRLSIAVVHYPTMGGDRSKPNWDINERYARHLGEWGAEKRLGGGLSFVTGDFNMTFNTGPDPMFGEKYTSSWNELSRFEGTGHGNIDAILSYDPDKRVSAKSVRALDDKEFFLHSDHYVVQSTYYVKPVKSSRRKWWRKKRR